MRRDLAFVVALACAALLAALLPTPVWLRATLLLPLVLFLPGYATAANLFAPGTVTRIERWIYAVTLSVAIAVLVGLAVQLVLDLDRAVWAALLAGVTVLAAFRAPRAERGTAIAWPQALSWKLPVAGLAFAAAAVVVALAIVSAGQGLRDAQAEIHFTSFWMLPQGRTAESAEMLVGLRNHEARATTYGLRLSREGRLLAAERLTLRPGQQWERRFPVGHGQDAASIVATLSRDGQLYRRLDVLPPR